MYLFASDFFRRRLTELAGLGLLALAVFLAVATFSYHGADPSFNRATTVEPVNAAGLPGAYTADLSLQVLGGASFVLMIVPLFWGFLLLRDKEVSRLWLRISLLMLCLPATAGWLALFEAPISWPVASGLGGFVGLFIKQQLMPLLTLPGYVIVMLSLSLVTFAFSLAVPLTHLWGAMLTAWGFVADQASHGYHFVRSRLRPWEYEDEEDVLEEPEDEEEWDENDEEEEDEILEEDSASGKRFSLKETLALTRRKQKEIKPAVKKKAPISRSKSSEARGKKAVQEALALPSESGYTLPALKLLQTPKGKSKKGLSNSALAQNARLLESVLEDFGVFGEIVNIRPGPVVTLYELEPAAGTKTARVIGLAEDIARSMSAISARIAVIPGQNAIGIELPNANRETVYLRSLLESEDFTKGDQGLPLTLGKDIGGDAIIADLAKMPHLLVAGTTGSGKSVAINAMIISLLYRLPPEQCKFIMIDPKMLELSIYEGIPHLLSPVVTEPGKAVVALKWTVKEMENRYRLMSNLGVRNINGYNKRILDARRKGEELTRHVQTGFDTETGEPIYEDVPLEMNPLPYIVVVVDEMADLMLVAGKDIEASIQRLAQMARAAGIHLIMATQRPSVDVITGVVKANFPTRISFQVTSRIDSRTILGEQGAEQLLGMGDMLYMAGGGRVTRVHGPFVSDKEVEEVVSFLKAQGEPEYVEEVTEESAAESEFFKMMEGDGNSEDALYDQAVAIVCRDRKASISYLQRKLKVGYNRAATLVERLEEEGVISQPNHVGKREVLAPNNS